MKNRNIRDEMLKMEQFLDADFNINLSEAISAIYLEEYFETNIHADELLKKVIGISKEKDISVYGKTRRDEKIIDIKVE